MNNHLFLNDIKQHIHKLCSAILETPRYRRCNTLEVLPKPILLALITFKFTVN